MQRTWTLAMLVCGCVLFVAAPSRSQTAATDVEAAKNGAAKNEDTAGKPAEDAESDLTTEQRQVAERFRELEKLLLRMAELTAPTDPRRAALLRQAVAQSKQRDIDHQFEELIELLKQERLAIVVKNQGAVQQDLARLLELLLSEDRSKRIESEKERVREYLKRVNKIIKEQKSVQGETERGGDERKLSDKQGELSEKTGELAGDLKQDAGKKPPGEAADKQGQDGDQKDDDKEPQEKRSDPPGDKPGDNEKNPDKEQEKKDQGKQGQGDPQKGDADPKEGKNPKGDESPQGDKGQPGDAGKSQPGESQPGESQGPQQSGDQNNPAQQRLEKAQQRMKEAQKKLEEAKRSDALDKQAEAIKELEQAKAELEEILRQLREEEMARTLAMLEARFRKMLDMQVDVYEGTKRVDKVPAAERDRDDEIEAGRLSRKESQIATEADKALSVLREEGSAVAFPEAVTEMREDMEQVVSRLAAARVGDVTQGIESDIIAALEEMIAALQKAQKDMEQKNQQSQPPPNGEQEEPLVDTLSELKMIRALQMRVNVRTGRYAKMTKTEQTDLPELLEALKRLGEREQRIHKVTRDIVLGRNR